VLGALKRLDDQARQLERYAAGPTMHELIAQERLRSPSYGGRSVYGWEHGRPSNLTGRRSQHRLDRSLSASEWQSSRLCSNPLGGQPRRALLPTLRLHDRLFLPVLDELTALLFQLIELGVVPPERLPPRSELPERLLDRRFELVCRNEHTEPIVCQVEKPDRLF